MKNRNFLWTAALLVLGAGTTVTAVQGDTYRPRRQSVAPALETDRSFGDAEAARQFNSLSDSTGTTVRWLGSKTNSSYQNSSRDENPQESRLQAVRQNRPLHRLPTPQAKSKVVRAQANEDALVNEDVFYTTQNFQEELTPGASSDTDVGSEENLGLPLLANDACYGSGCDAIGCQPPRPCRRRTLVMGTEAVFLSPDLNGRRSSFVFENFATPSHYNYSPGSSVVEDAALDDFYIAPRLWLGVQGQCWGVVGRYFHLRAGENDYDPYIPATLDQGYDVNSVFDAYYTDLELTRNFCLHGSKNQFTFGARYALIEHNESVIAMAEVPQGLINGGARSNRQAHGTGLTFGLNGRKPLFRNSCAHWFYNVRSSILWGNTTNSVETWSETILLSADPDVSAVAGSKNGAIAQLDDDLFIGEVQLGLEWNFAMRCLPARSFFRLAFEYQYWDAGSGNATSNSFSGFSETTGGVTTATSSGTANAGAPGLQVDLIGFHVGTGFTW